MIKKFSEFLDEASHGDRHLIGIGTRDGKEVRGKMHNARKALVKAGIENHIHNGKHLSVQKVHAKRARDHLKGLGWELHD